MKWLQKLGKALMLPVACLPICGILMGIGYLLCPETMQGGEIAGVVPAIGLLDVYKRQAESVTTMVCSSRRSGTVIRWKCRITG